MGKIRTHLNDTLSWSHEVRVDWVAVLAGSAGMAIPVMVGAGVGSVGSGLIAALGSLLVGRTETGDSFGAQIRHQAQMVGTAAVAALGGVLIAGPGWTSDLGMVLLAGGAALLGGLDRQFAIATARFAIFLIILLNLADTVADPVAVFTLLAMGALLTCLIALGAAGVVRAAGTALPPVPNVTDDRTIGQQMRRIRVVLARPAAWHFPIRLVICLCLASIVRHAWPEHHYIWIALTIAIIARRELEVLPIHLTQRVTGSLIGVAASGLFILWPLSTGYLGLVIGVLAGLRLWLTQRNYLAYSVVMTPLVILLLDGDRPVEIGLLVDRLVATGGAGLLVMAVNGGFVWWQTRSS